MSEPLVLLADDYIDASEMYAAYLRYHGFRVVTAMDGNEAVQAARLEKPDIVLLDLRMPVMGGIETVRVLKMEPGFGDVPIVALTAHARPEERDAAIAAGFDAYLSKPISPDQLVVQLVALLESRKQVP